MNLSIESSKEQKPNPFLDKSLWLLFAVNVFTIFLAISQEWKLTTLMWIYWFQSVIIGFFNFIRILQLKEFTTEGYKINNVQPESTEATKIVTAIFFLVHFGIFHLVYFLFLFFFSIVGIFGPVPSTNELLWIIIISFLFFINHFFSYLYNRAEDDHKPNIGVMTFYPYARILPMHLTIVGFGFIINNSLLLFLILKTFADCIMHVVEHRYLRTSK